MNLWTLPAFIFAMFAPEQILACPEERGAGVFSVGKPKLRWHHDTEPRAVTSCSAVAKRCPGKGSRRRVPLGFAD